MSLPVKKLLTEFDVHQNKKLFEAVQGYTLVSHGRQHVWLGLLRLDSAVKTDVQKRDFVERLSSIGAQATSALNLYQSYQDHKANRDDADYEKHRVIIAVGLAWPSYDLFPNGKPESKAFQDGFKQKFSSVLKSEGDLKEPEYERYAVIVLASNNPDRLTECEQEIADHFKGLARVTWEKGETKRVKLNGKNVVQDHFGYREGISQPVFFDFEDHRTSEWTSDWDPAVGLGCVLTSQPDRRDENEYGSFMAYLKIKQEVDHFKQVVKHTATALSAAQSLSKTTVEDVMGKLVGRTPEGKPLTGCDAADLNDFDFANDPQFSRCPISAHIRKVNPRTEHSRNKRILRRGVLYDDGKEQGTLFQCFQSDLSTGFEYIFGEWIMNADLPERNSGKDSLLGTSFSVATLTAAIAKQASPKERLQIDSKLKEMEATAIKAAAMEEAPAQRRVAKAAEGEADIQASDLSAQCHVAGTSMDRKQFTEIKAGEYFYFPSIPFFRRLAPPPGPSE